MNINFSHVHTEQNLFLGLRGINKKQSRGPLNQNSCPEGQAWDEARKGCYPSKKEEAKMKKKATKQK
mgnify:CR=1 FL=1